jgi:peroxiredoxin Q/BCP
MLDLNTKAPSFITKDQNNKDVSLSDFLGHYVVLYFYPKDDTAGCTKEACSIRDSYSVFQKYAVVLGVSADSIESHKKFEEKYQLPFLLLADTNKEIIKKYGADGPFTRRITYLIDPAGIIIKVYPKVDPSVHSEELLRDLEALGHK